MGGEHGPTIERIHLQNYKAFADFSTTFSKTSLLVGPNSAGKSTVIEALKGVAAMVRQARRIRAPSLVDQGNRQYWVHPFRLGEFGIEADNLRHEFRPVDTTCDVVFAGGSGIQALWPKDERSGYFRLYRSGFAQTRFPDEVRRHFPDIGVIPVLTPIDRNEAMLDPKWVRRNFDGRLASRHFRNQLELLRSESTDSTEGFDAFRAFCSEWLPELRLDTPSRRDAELDVFYRDTAKYGTSMEIVWAGDGIQVFLQLLLHLFRLRDVDVIVLDEPDVYLHADLQRRLIRLLDSMGPQIILATHSAEMLAEADPEAVIWMDKTRSQAVRAPDPRGLSELSAAIGTAFNLPLARVLRARLALFVEGDDLRLIRHVAKTIGADNVVAEKNLAVVPLKGGTNWKRLEGFSWLADGLLQGAVHGQVVLDRDFHTVEAVTQLTDALKGFSLALHVWERHELESYLLNPATIGRSSGADSHTIASWLEELSAAMYGTFLTQMIATRYADGFDKGVSLTTVGKACEQEMQAFWNDPAIRVQRCPAKELLSGLNTKLQHTGFGTVSFPRLARTIVVSELADEITALLRKVDRRLA